MKSNKTYRKIKIKLMNLPRDDHDVYSNSLGLQEMHDKCVNYYQNYKYYSYNGIHF